MNVDLDALLEWVKSTVAVPVPSKLVPGASELERQRLGALGGLVGALVPIVDRVAWPSDVIDWMDAGPVPPTLIVESALRAIDAEPDETLATIYARLVSGVNRRALGTFFTPKPEVQLMLDMWADAEDPPASVVDVGAGVGVFTVASLSRWPDARVYGVDINPVTLGLLALRAWIGQFKLTQESSSDTGIRLVRDDFTVWIGTAVNDMPRPTLIIGNPPYTRSQMLPSEDRARLNVAADGLCRSRASLSALITAISLRHLGPSDGLCLLLPAQWLESEYAVPLRNYLAELKTRRIELRLVESRLFQDAQVDAVALQVGSARRTEQEFLVATWTQSNPKWNQRSVDRTALVDTQWRTLFSWPVAASVADPAAPASLLSDFCALRRGTATGANGFFVLNDIEVEEYRLQHIVIALVRRLNGLPDRVTKAAFDKATSSDKRWLLKATSKDRHAEGPVDHYLKMGEDAEIDKGYLCSDRAGDWYDLRHDLVVPDVIVGPMTRGTEMRFVENEISAAILNNLYGWSWYPDVTAEARKSILSWLRGADGQASVFSAARNQGTGLQKIEPKALANVVIPASIARPPGMLL